VHGPDFAWKKYFDPVVSTVDVVVKYPEAASSSATSIHEFIFRDGWIEGT